jgi:hypothetical protein
LGNPGGGFFFPDILRKLEMMTLARSAGAEGRIDPVCFAFLAIFARDFLAEKFIPEHLHADD